MLGGLRVTATRSRRNKAPKGGKDRGAGKALSSFIFRIIEGPWTNWIILEALYTIDWYAVKWVQPCGCVCMTRLLPFRLPGERAVSLRIIRNALEQSLSFMAPLMSCEMCSRHRERCVRLDVAGPNTFAVSMFFFPFLNSFDETRSGQTKKGRKVDNVEKK